jgi:ADP-glucose pyrophosphorylase
MTETCAFIFSSGKGTRLQPYTLETPKPLLPIDNQGGCILSCILENLIGQEIREVFINYSYGKDYFVKLAANYRQKIRITLIPDEQVLGQGGILIQNRELLKNYDAVLCLNGDTLVELNYNHLIKLHDLTKSYFLSDTSVEKAKPYLLLDDGGNLIGYQSPTRDDLYFYPSISADRLKEKVNYLGVILIPTNFLVDLTFDGNFLGLFGRDDLTERLYLKGRFTRPFANVTVEAFISMDTCEEYERILQENGHTRPILRS